MLSNLDVLKMILMVDDLRSKAEDASMDQPYRVDEEGNVVDSHDDPVYFANDLRPDDPKVIVTIYNALGWLEWDDIHPLVEMIVDKQEANDG